MNTDKSVEQESPMERLLKQLIPGIAGLLVAVLGAYIVWFSSAKVSHDSADWGTLGDYFGGLMNPVISFATLMVAYSVWKQQKEELRQTKEALEEQAKTAEQQRQEQRFFDLLRLYERTEESITVTESLSASADSAAIHLTGKAAIHQVVTDGLPRSIRLFLRHGIGEFNVDGSKMSINEANLTDIWNKSATASQFDHYFRVVFRLLADSEALLGDQHFQYVKLLRAQFGRSELTLLGLNLWIDNEGKKMIPLAARYGLLKHLQSGKLRQELESRLPPLVFGRRFAIQKTQVDQLEPLPC